MKIVLEINCDNEAFADTLGSESARILERVARDLRAGTINPDGPNKLRDINGNTVGFVQMSEG